MRKKLFIGANWKMHSPPEGAMSKESPYVSSGDPEIVVFPTFIDLQNCIRSGALIVGAQCGRAESDGPFTGDVSMAMLKAFGCTYVLCGHSERRRHHEESNEAIGMQVNAAIDAGLIPVLCIGESADQHEMGIAEETVRTQVTAVLMACGKKLKPKNFIVAYEPVWAIGTGVTPKPEDVQVMHAFIRALLPDPGVRVIYGGSVTGKNAKEFFACPDVDGALVGGASLTPKEFAAIVAA